MRQTLPKLLASNHKLLGLWAGFSSFLAYFCMYMYRKPFTAGTYETFELWGLDYKTIIIIAQVLGYALSKFLGIKIISELDNSKRIKLFCLFISIAWLALVGFAFAPVSTGPIWLFINGIPLGMIWGIVFSYCEGRSLTEVLTVFLSTNFILSSGLAKTIGQWLLNLGISEHFMPMTVGLLVLPLLCISLWMLNKIPPPNKDEVKQKTKRVKMSNRDKKQFLKQYYFPLILFVSLYLLLTIIRDIRDNFAVEIWSGIGYKGNPEIFTSAELPIAVLMLISLALLYKIKNNKKALMTNVMLCIAGIGILILSTYLFKLGLISSLFWMIISGMGIFLPYILLNGILFDRFIAHYQIVGNVGFIMYISDATGYLGSVFIMLYKNFGNANMQWSTFYISLCTIGSIIGLVLALGIYFVFKRDVLITSPQSKYLS